MAYNDTIYLAAPADSDVSLLQNEFLAQGMVCRTVETGEKAGADALKTMRDAGQILFLAPRGASLAFLEKWWRGQADAALDFTPAADWKKIAADCCAAMARNRNVPLKTVWFRQLCKEAAETSREYRLLEPGDRILVGISGGEDSLTLMHVLKYLQARMNGCFKLFPVFVDMGFDTINREALWEYCRTNDWNLETARINGTALIAEHEAENSPCSLCSRLRRGQLHAAADRLECNKICLGQHLDDLCASFLMSLFRGGGLKTMGPNVPADTASKSLIRPLALSEKATVHAAARFMNFPKIKSCPYEEQLQADGDRAYCERLLDQLDAHFPFVRNAMKHSMGDVRLRHLLDQKRD